MTTLKIGDKAPNFESKDHEGRIIKLTDYKGKKLILFFYPRASTPGCTAEVCNLRDNYKTLSDKGYELLGVSADTAKKQENFINKNSLPFPLLPATWMILKFSSRMSSLRNSSFVCSNPFFFVNFGISALTFQQIVVY